MSDDYKLSPEVHDLILQELKSDCFRGLKSVENPQVFILGGQPGSGKSNLIKNCCLEFSNDNYVIINADEYRYAHPKAPEIFAKHDKDFALYTDPDDRLWGKEIFEAARKERLNIIFEGTMRTSQICETIKQMKDEGYKINIRALAVPKIKSRISIYTRYQQQLELGLPARFTHQKTHDEAYNGMLGTLQKIEEGKLYDTIEIHDREGKILFKTGDKNIVEAVQAERNKPLSAKDKEELNQDCTDLIARMIKRGEDKRYINDLADLRQSLEVKPKCRIENINRLRGLGDSSSLLSPKAQPTNIDFKSLRYIHQKKLQDK